MRTLALLMVATAVAAQDPVYKPTLLNGRPITVETEVSVPFAWRED